MRYVSLLLVAAVLSGFSFSCTSFPEPNERQTTLLFGRIVQTGKNYPTHGSASVNGTNTVGIVVSITNTDTNQKYKLYSQYGGYFSSLVFPSGNYELKSFYLTIQSGNSVADILMNPGNDRRFTIVSGVVNNLGLIEWNCDAEEGMTYWLDKGYSDVREYFAARYPKSGWNSLEWRNVTIER